MIVRGVDAIHRLDRALEEVLLVKKEASRLIGWAVTRMNTLKVIISEVTDITMPWIDNIFWDCLRVVDNLLKLLKDLLSA